MTTLGLGLDVTDGWTDRHGKLVERSLREMLRIRKKRIEHLLTFAAEIIFMVIFPSIMETKRAVAW